ncbi:MAG: HdeD family acid-resistance protein [Nocardioidaceae bacterium]
MFKSLGNSLILRGLLALGIGVGAVAWPGVTVFALVVMFAVYAFVSAGLQAALAFGSRTAKPVVAHLLVGLVDVTAGVIALAWPGATALVLVLLVASWAIVTGVIEVVAGFRSSEAAGTRAMFVLGGLLSVVFGVVLCINPGMGAITLALLFGLFNLVSGTTMLINGIELRSANAKPRSLPTPDKREKTHAAA